MTTVIGVDGSYTRTGLTVYRDGAVACRSILAPPQTKGEPSKAARRAVIRRAIAPHMAGARLVVIEAVHLLRGRTRMGRTPLDLAMLFGSIEDMAHDAGVPVASPEPSQIKQFATGKGNSGKASVWFAADEQLGITTANHDEADSLWAAMLGVYALGETLNGWEPSDKQAEPLGTVRWPW